MPRSFQFSLRALLMTITAISVWLGVEVNAARRQRAIVSQIEQIGGAVGYDWELDDNGDETLAEHPSGPPWLRRWIGDDYFQTVVAVYCEQIPSLNDEHFPAVDQLPELTTLVLHGTHVRDASLSRISRLKRLRFLDVSETDVTDAGTDAIARMTTLKELWVGKWTAPPRHAVTDAGIRRLTPLSNLELLLVAGYGVTDASVPVLEQFEKLSQLSLVQTAITERGAERLAKSLPNCEVTLEP